ncbi:hypothetical protein GTW71_13470, partial [Streptomyces sp. SID6041]|nr:hypothetical protein [Streptomyces sp. SID6041]
GPDGRSAPEVAGGQDRSAAEPSGLLWDLHPGYVLHPGDRVVVAATRAGLAELLGRAADPAPEHTPSSAVSPPPGD